MLHPPEHSPSAEGRSSRALVLPTTILRLAGIAGIVAIAGIPVVAQAQIERGGSVRPTARSAVAPPGATKNSIHPEIEYISGHEGFSQKKKGQLVVTAEGVEFFDNKGKQVFALPIGTIRTAEHTRDIRDASVGKKLLFGALAGDRKQDFLTLTTETDSTAEGVVFKAKQNAGTGIAAKINFYVRKAQGDTPGPEEESPAVAAVHRDQAPEAREAPATLAAAPAPAREGAPPVRLGIPPGMNWVGDSETKQYFPAQCAAVAQVPEEQRYYYPAEEGVQKDGYSRGSGC